MPKTTLHITALTAVLVAAILFAALPAGASAPPVGPLPPGQVTTVSAKRGTFVAVALPAQSSSSGLVWRFARGNPAIVRQVAERTLGLTVVIVFKAVARGKATVSYGLTKAESKKAYKSVTYKLTIS
jgi:O-antigen/teichoic acid export membrane protein